MIKVENMEFWGFDHAIRGMRNPLNSWSRSDSMFDGDKMSLGNNDLTLMKRLYAGGQPHRKYLRQIFVAMDITAPLYWFKEFDTYKVGTTANSCSTMHKIAAKEFMIDDFSHEHLISTCLLESIINELNIYRDIYNNYDKQTEEYKAEFSQKDIWWQMIQLLPSSYNQLRTVTMTYENVMNMLDYRQGHKLDEWNEFCKILLELPYVAELRDSKGGQR